MNKKGKDGYYPTIIKVKFNEHVPGFIYCIPQKEMKKLDKYKGLGRGYRAAWLDAIDKNGKLVHFYTCIGLKLKNNLPVHDWYREYVLTGAKDHDLPEYYINKLENVFGKLTVKTIG